LALELYPHQQKALKEMHNGCVLKGDVGSGKTIAALAYFYVRECGGSICFNGVGENLPPTAPRDIYVITTAKKRDDLDWEQEAAAFGISSHRDVGTNGIRLTVDSWNNILDYTGVKDAFFIFDEQRLVGSGAWVKAFNKLAAANRWIMLSATPGDTWMDYVPLFVANGFYRNRSHFVEEHVVWDRFAKYPKINRYLDEDKLRQLRTSVLVEMPFSRHTVRHTSNYLVEYDRELFQVISRDRWNIYEGEPLPDAGAMVRIMRQLVNSDPSRVGAVMKLLEKHDRLIVFYNFNYELNALRTLSDILGIESAEWNGHKHQDVPTTDKWLYLVQYTAGAEGWNCITTNAMVFYSLNYSYKINEQAKGRIDRLNTRYTDLFYYILRSAAPIDTAIAKSIVTKKNFNKKDFEKKIWKDDMRLAA
jgi:hypothetical protein